MAPNMLVFPKYTHVDKRAYCGAAVVECTTSVPEITCEVGAGLAAEYVVLFAK